MNKMKKIIAFALMMVMMMAMSVTAFAANTTTTITVTNLSANEATEVSIYKIAEINQDKWKFSDWVTEDLAYLEKDATEYTFKYDDMAKAVAKITPDNTLSTTKGVTSVQFTDVKAGAYLVLAKGTRTTYSTMVARTYKYKNGVFVADAATVVAKASETKVVKDTNDTFVSADELVTFTISTEVPYIAENATDTSFVLYENPTNLKNLTVTSVKLADEEKKTANTFNLVEINSSAKYELNLTSLVADKNANAGKSVLVTITANVDGVNGYENTVWSNYSDPDVDYNTNTVKGYTGSIELTKVDAKNTENKLSGAKFRFSRDGQTLKFVATEVAGVYSLSAQGTLEELEVNSNGVVKVQGLSEGTYNIEETQAPEGYAINPRIPSVTITPEIEETTRLSVDQAKGNIDLKGEKYYVFDTTLASLPFTGGMGTTIFTVLGVALMAIAAALYFASKKSAKN